MKSYNVSLIVLFFFFIHRVTCYLAQSHSPYTITFKKEQQDVLEFKKGDTIYLEWQLTPGVNFPLYGYASSRTSKTDVGLLKPGSSRTEPYLYMIDMDVVIQDYAYSWTIGQDVPTGRYQIGIGFFYHETSPEIYIRD